MKENTLGKAVLLILLISIGCGGKKANESSTEEKKQLQMYVFNVGSIQVNDVSGLNGGAEVEAPVHLTNSAFLIRHPKGDLIWDTGFADSVMDSPLGEPTSPYYSTMSKTLASQLAEIQMAPDEIEYLAVSHKHPDHAGNMRLFPQSTILIQNETYRDLFESEQSEVDLESLRENTVRKLNGDLDVFGDGSVRIIRTPGHTAGHQVLYIDLPETGPIVLSGDLWVFNLDIKTQQVPLFNEDAEATSESWEKIKTLLKEKQATLWVQHDSKQMLSIPHSPEVIR